MSAIGGMPWIRQGDKLGAIFFTILWIGGMLWWSGEYHPAYIILLAVCGSIGGYL
jgi:hypothetical protein